MIELLNCDCMDYMADLEDNAFDLAIVDPPYGIGVKTNMGRRAGVYNANPVATWDTKAPAEGYFRELRRTCRNLIIWGANHFIDNLPFNANSACWLMWDKGFSSDLTFAQFELAWTTLDGTCKKYDKPPSERGRIHPTQKPVKLYNWILTNYAKPGQRILDTHLGSGSSAIAAHYFGCDFVGCEIDPDYYKAAKERFDMETRQLDIFA